MGQQQLLLLVLATVIVGLATVAGIQAFNENQAQASQDALVQRATSVAADIKGLHGKPTQLGGIDLVSGDGYGNADDIARSLGMEANPFETQGAGPSSYCEIVTGDGGNTNVTNGGDAASIRCVGGDAPQNVVVSYDANADEVTTDFLSSGSFSISSTGTL